MRTILLFVVTSALIACSGSDDSMQAEMSASKTEPGQTNRDFAAALNAKDAKAAAAQCTEDAGLIPPGEPFVRGRDAIEEYKPVADYEVGQVWEYKTRPGEEGSRIYIAKIDEYATVGKVFHIFVDGLKLRSKHIEAKYQSTLPHLPVSASSLDASVTNLIEISDDLPDISEGYMAWKESQGGVFTIPIAEIIEIGESSMNQ